MHPLITKLSLKFIDILINNDIRIISIQPYLILKSVILKLNLISDVYINFNLKNLNIPYPILQNNKYLVSSYLCIEGTKRFNVF